MEYNTLLIRAGLRVALKLEPSTDKALLIKILSGALVEEELQQVLKDYPLDLEEEDITSYQDYEELI